MNNVTYCTSCWVKDRDRRLATVEIDGDPYCGSCAIEAGYSAEEIAKADKIEQPAPAPVAQPRITTPPAKREREEQTMTTAKKICGREGCGKELTERNNSGFCQKHFYDSKLKTNGHAAPKPAAAKAARKTNGNGRAHAADERVTIEVPISHLDNWWTGMSAAEKARCFSLAIEQ